MFEVFARSDTRGDLYDGVLKQVTHDLLLFLSPDSKTASGESGQNMVPCGLERALAYCRSGGLCVRSGATRCGPLVLPGLQGKGLVWQRSILLS